MLGKKLNSIHCILAFIFRAHIAYPPRLWQIFVPAVPNIELHNNTIQGGLSYSLLVGNGP